MSALKGGSKAKQKGQRSTSYSCTSYAPVLALESNQSFQCPTLFRHKPIPTCNDQQVEQVEVSTLLRLPILKPEVRLRDRAVYQICPKQHKNIRTIPHHQVHDPLSCLRNQEIVLRLLQVQMYLATCLENRWSRKRTRKLHNMSLN